MRRRHVPRRAAPAESIGIPRRRFSPPSSRRALLQFHGEKERERERKGGKATGEGRDGTKGRENVKLPPLFSGALLAGRADWTGLDWLGGSLQKELRAELSRP